LNPQSTPFLPKKRLKNFDVVFARVEEKIQEFATAMEGDGSGRKPGRKYRKIGKRENMDSC
jgi:hypothetical protein